MEIKHPYVSPTPGEFPIMAWGPTSRNQMPTLSDFENFALCGFNVALFRGSDDNANGQWLKVFKEGFSLAQQTGVRIIVNSAILNYYGIDMPFWATQLVNEFKDNPQTAGWMVKDEPLYDELFTETKVEWHDSLTASKDNPVKIFRIKDALNRVYSLDNRHMAFFNLAVDTGKSFIGELGTYPNYLSEINDTFAPPVWSYDYYPVRKDSTGKVYVNKTKFYEYLGYFKSISDVSGKPFWAYCMCRASTDFPEPTIGMLRFEAFSALAYGAQGIVYFEYRTDEVDKTTPTTYDGDRTTIWYTVSAANEEIRKWQKVFLGCTVVRLVNVNKYDSDNVMKEAIDCVDEIWAKGPGIVLSKIQNGSKKYIVIVSCDPLEKQDVYIKFNSSYQISPSRPEDLNTEQSTLGSKYSLPEGGYLIIEYSE